MINYIVLGGPVMIPIGIVSIVAFSICIEKFFTLRQLMPPPAAFVAGISDCIRRRDWQQALIICRNSKHPLAQIFDAGLVETTKPLIDLHAIEEAARLKGDETIFRMESSLKLLSALISTLPLLGFLGTIIGLIVAFQQWQALGTSITVAQLSGGMYQAMITTAAGLILAIPYFLMHHWFQAKLDAGALRLSYYSTEFISRIRQAILSGEEIRSLEIEKPLSALSSRK